jgi:hypothetical protein
MRPLISLAFLAVVLAGCTPTFYLTDADVATYTAQLGSQSGANGTLAPWSGATIRLEFTMTGTGASRMPRIRSSNLRQVFRERGVGRFPPEALERAGAEVERELDTWIGPELASLADRLGARLSALKTLTLIVREAPVFTFDAARGQVNFTLGVQVSVTGDIYVPQVGRRYAGVRLEVSDYRLVGTLHFGPVHPQGTRVRLAATPSPGRMSVSGIRDRAVRNEVERQLAAPLSAAVDVTRALSYSQFAVPQLQFVQEPVPRIQSRYVARPEVPEPVLHVLTRSPAGHLHHGRREGGIWTPFTPIAMAELVAGDPALISSGNDRLDAVAVAASGRLLHATFREGEWGEVAAAVSLGPLRFATRRPALVTTAPGQLEVVTVSTDGLLQHVRRLDGRWLGPNALVADVPMRVGLVTPPFRDPVLAQAGSKLILLFVDQRARLFSMLHDLETGVWGPAYEIPSAGVRGAPAAAGCGDGSVDAVYVRQSDGAIVHQRLFLFTGGVGGEARSNPVVIGGLAATGDPTLACSGYQRLELLVPGRNREVFHNHYTHSAGEADGRRFTVGWQGWERVAVPLIRSEHSPTLRTNGPLEALASSTGHLHVLGPGWMAWTGSSPSGQPLSVWHNAFLAQRWGQERWASVHWRGWQETAAPQVLGRPALALVDRHVDVVLTGPDGGLRRASVATGIPARFTGGRATARPRHDAEPMALATAPGVLDVLYLGADERLHHLRDLDGRLPVDVRVHERPGLTSLVRPAAIPVAGHLEVVVRASDATLKHWRYRVGRWEGPHDIPDSTNVISAPALVGIGRGRLELFAVRDNQRVHHWRFEGGQWTPGRVLESDMAVNAVLFTGLAVSSWGDGTVDLVVAESSSGRMFHRRVTPDEAAAAGSGSRIGHPRFVEMGGPPAASIGLVALGPTHLRVLGSTGGDRYFSIWSVAPPLAQRGGLPGPGGTALTGVPRRGIPEVEYAPPLDWHSRIFAGRALEIAGMTALGARELLAGGVDRQGRVYLSRFRDWTWSGFVPLYAQPPEAQPSPFMLPGFTGR